MAIQTYAKNVGGKPIAFTKAAYPYWYADTNGNGRIDPEETKPDNKYTAYTPRLLQATFNWTFSLRDPGGAYHNGRYIVQLLHDSLESLAASNKAGVDTEGQGPPVDAPHGPTDRMGDGRPAVAHVDSIGVRDALTFLAIATCGSICPETDLQRGQPWPTPGSTAGGGAETSRKGRRLEPGRAGWSAPVSSSPRCCSPHRASSSCPAVLAQTRLSSITIDGVSLSVRRAGRHRRAIGRRRAIRSRAELQLRNEARNRRIDLNVRRHQRDERRRDGDAELSRRHSLQTLPSSARRDRAVDRRGERQGLSPIRSAPSRNCSRSSTRTIPSSTRTVERDRRGVSTITWPP